MQQIYYDTLEEKAKFYDDFFIKGNLLQNQIIPNREPWNTIGYQRGNRLTLH